MNKTNNHVLFMDAYNKPVYNDSTVSFTYSNKDDNLHMHGKMQWNPDELRYEIDLPKEYFPYSVLSYNMETMSNFSVKSNPDIETLNTDGKEVREITIIPHDLEDISLEPIEEAISEYISDSTGFCHYGFSYKLLVSATLDVSE